MSREVASWPSIAQTTYAYDGTAPTLEPQPVPGHDDTNHGTGFNTRGNLTKTSRWLKLSSTWLSTTNTFDTLGNKLSTTDPNGNQTTFSYADLWSSPGCTASGKTTYAFVTLVTQPNTLNQQSGTVHHRTQNTYYPCTGLIEGTQNENDILAGRAGTTFGYDLMNRKNSVSYPDGGGTTWTFTDTVPVSALAKTTIDTSLFHKKQTTLDGLGRPLNVLSTDPDCTTGVNAGWTEVDYGYGFTPGSNTSFKSVTNPYCQTPAGTTTTNSDALNRVISVAQADGSTVSTSYSGNCSTVTDEAGKTRESCFDGLGRMTQVFEDPGSSHYETDYAYDVLDNLTGVTQKGGSTSGNYRNRSFTYDSLSRLRCSANPEVTSSVNSVATCPATDQSSYTAGTISYSYDNNGNLTSKVAAAPNQTGTTTVTATTNYDALNRPLDTIYSDGTTPNSSYRYDDSLTWWNLQPTNAVGHVTLASASLGALGMVYSYDPMGRVILTYQNPPSLTYKIFNYTYFMDGEPKTITYPSGRVITYTSSVAGRSTSAVDTANGINYATGVSYAPFGGLTGMINGSGATNPISTTNTYNSRLQPLRLHSYSGNNLILDLTYDFHAGAGDNGNVLKITNARDGMSGQTVGTVSYTYDALNRVASASTSGTDCTVIVNNLTNNWGESYGIDAWGNVNTITPTKCTAENLAFSANVRNQPNGYCYDAAGNLLGSSSCSTPIYTFDGANRLTATAGYTYAYDADGRRVKKAAGSSGTAYFYDPGSDVLTESDLSGNVQNEYIFFNGKRLARRDVGAAVHYYYSDYLGSANVTATAANGTIEDEEDFYPFGGKRLVMNQATQEYQFTGKEFDYESNLDYFGARHYANAWGRFVQADWAEKPAAVPYAHYGNPQSLNLYSYVENNPTTVGDPDGHDNAATGDKIVPTSQEVQAQNSGWSLSWQVNASANFLVGEVKGVADATVTPVVNAVEHPIQTVEGIANAVEHPVDTAKAIANGAVNTVKAAANGDPRAFGQVVGTVAAVAYAAENVRPQSYPNAGGGGVNILNTPTTGSRIGLDVHGIPEAGGAVRPHIDITIKKPGVPSGPGSNLVNIKHWPW